MSEPERPTDETPELSKAMANALLKQDSVLEIMAEFLRAHDVDIPLSDLPHEAQSTLLAALVADGAVTISLGTDNDEDDDD